MSQSPDELSSDPNLSDILEALAEDPLFEKEVEQLCNSPMSMTGVMLQPLDSPKNQSVTMMSGVELEPLDTPKLPDATMMSGVELQPLDPPKLPDTNMMSGVELQPLDTPKFPDTNMMSGVKLQRLDTQKLPDVRMMPGVQLLNGTSPQLQNPTLRPGLEAEAEKPQKAPIRTIRTKPRVEIVEQPASKGLRFRYKCEGRLAGSIPGANSTRKKKTFPTIRIHGHPGKAIVIVSCVTADPPYRPHPHNLVGKEQCNKGICVVPMPPNLTYSFTNLGIQCVKRRDMRESLEQRELEHLDPFRTGFEHKYKTNLINQAVVRLCFQVFLETPATGGLCTYPLPPVLSNPIIDKKTTSDLIIYKMSHASASAFGGEEILVLCEKVVKGDIRVRFYEGNENNPTWEDFATFKPNYVHKQVALSFRSPCYRNKYIQEPVKVFVQLVRPSDGETSDSLPFQLLPKEDDPIMRQFNNTTAHPLRFDDLRSNTNNLSEYDLARFTYQSMKRAAMGYSSKGQAGPRLFPLEKRHSPQPHYAVRGKSTPIRRKTRTTKRKSPEKSAEISSTKSQFLKQRSTKPRISNSGYITQSSENQSSSKMDSAVQNSTTSMSAATPATINYSVPSNKQLPNNTHLLDMPVPPSTVPILPTPESSPTDCNHMPESFEQTIIPVNAQLFEKPGFDSIISPASLSQGSATSNNYNISHESYGSAVVPINNQLTDKPVPKSVEPVQPATLAPVGRGFAAPINSNIRIQSHKQQTVPSNTQNVDRRGSGPAALVYPAQGGAMRSSAMPINRNVPAEPYNSANNPVNTQSIARPIISPATLHSESRNSMANFNFNVPVRPHDTRTIPINNNYTEQTIHGSVAKTSTSHYNYNQSFQVNSHLKRQSIPVSSTPNPAIWNPATSPPKCNYNIPNRQYDTTTYQANTHYTNQPIPSSAQPPYQPQGYPLHDYIATCPESQRTVAPISYNNGRQLRDLQPSYNYNNKISPPELSSRQVNTHLLDQPVPTNLQGPILQQHYDMHLPLMTNNHGPAGDCNAMNNVSNVKMNGVPNDVLNSNTNGFNFFDILQSGVTPDDLLELNKFIGLSPQDTPVNNTTQVNRLNPFDIQTERSHLAYNETFQEIGAFNNLYKHDNRT